MRGVDGRERGFDIGRRVKAGELLSLEDIYALGKPVMEAEIADHLMPDLTEETLEIMNTQRMTDNGRKAQFRAIVLIGDRKGHFGIGAGIGLFLGLIGMKEMGLVVADPILFP